MRRLKSMPVYLSYIALAVVAAVLFFTLPKAEFSQLENRPLATLEHLSPESGLTEQLERYLADHFPAHDALVKAQATLSAATGSFLKDDVLLCRDQLLVEEPQRNLTPVARAAVDTLAALSARMAAPLTLCVVPTSAQYAGDALPPLYENTDQGALIAQLAGLAEGAEVLPTADLLRPSGLSNYYRTDHHLTAAGAAALYKGLCDLWGLEPAWPELVEAAGFYGSYWAKRPTATVSADTFTAWVPEGITLTVDGKVMDSLLQPEALAGRNKYAALISGTYGHALLENPAGSGRLLVLCDSNANVLAPLLAQHFAAVELVDARYFAGNLTELGSFDRVLACYGLNTLCTNRSLLALAAD